MRSLRLTVLLLACVLASGAAADYPDKPIRLVVPQAAGSATDTVARILGAEVGKEIAAVACRILQPDRSPQK